MKGFTHFVAGLAITSFFPWAVDAAARGNPLYFLLGGACALLPDTLDFRLLRYFYRYHVEITPDPLQPDMQMVADAIANAIDMTTSASLRLRLNTIRTGTDQWQKYHIHINAGKRQVIAKLDGIIDTGGNTIDDQKRNQQPAAIASFHAPVNVEYLASFSVEMFDGPHLELEPDRNGEIQIRFIPWHRAHTHSFCCSAMIALGIAMFGFWQAAIVCWCAHASHVLLDQLGYMGSNVLWPLSNQRFPGLKLQHAASAYWNFAAVWIAITVIFGNLSSHAIDKPAMPPVGYIVAVIILPLVLFRYWLASDT